jgi:hypothetical protein
MLQINHPRWHPIELVRRQPHPSTKQRRQRCWLRKKARPSWTTPPKRPPKTKLSAKGSAKSTPPPKAPYAPVAPEDYHKHHLQASLHQKVKTQYRTTKSSASQPRSSYSCGPCASRTTTSKSRKTSSRPSANVSLHRPRCAR